MKVVKYRPTERDCEFYARISPYVLSRNTEKEFGCKIYDDPDDYWLLFYDNNKFIGFTNYKQLNNYYKFGDIYVVESERKKGYGNNILGITLNKMQAHYIKVICNRKSLNIFIKNQFKVTKRFKNWTHLEFKKYKKKGD